MKKLRADLIRFIKVTFYNLQDIENEAEDIVNQTFLKICIKNYSELNFSLLSTIAKNEAINRFNEQKRNISLEQMENTLFDDDNNFNNLENEEDYQALALAREKLKASENQIIHLYYYEELNFIEISKRTGSISIQFYHTTDEHYLK